MLFLLSPAKTLDCTSPVPNQVYSRPDFLEQSQALVSILRDYSSSALGELMSISSNLSEQNQQRFQRWNDALDGEDAKASVYMFKGDVYSGLDVDTLDDAQMDYVNQNTRILSGLYGLLRPFDMILPYRLEMGTKLANSEGKDLYAFWQAHLSPALNRLQQKHIVNLASNEYFKAVDKKTLKAPITHVHFKDWKNDQYKIISFYAKKARGMMVSWAARNKATQPNDLKAFNSSGYQFSAEHSDDHNLTFLRTP